MRRHGTLVRWNAERGFGFIARADGRADVFVHVSALPRGGTPPETGELLSFEIEKGPDGRDRAVRVMRGGASRPQPAATPGIPRSRRIEVGPTVLMVCSVLAAMAYAVGKFDMRHRVESSPATPSTPPSRVLPVVAPRPEAAPAVPAAAFHCDGRTSCGQMSSCAEATYFLRNCPNTTMDGDHDGVPCEQQWCR